MQNFQQRSMFEAWQIGQEYRRWKNEKTGLRFGQWFCNNHNLTESTIYFESDNERAKHLILELVR